MVLERFDGVVFVGDEMLQSVYAAFNMLLREDVALGGLREGGMGGEERARCACEGQVRGKCRRWILGGSGEVGAGRASVCDRGFSFPFLSFSSRLIRWG